MGLRAVVLAVAITATSFAFYIIQADPAHAAACPFADDCKNPSLVSACNGASTIHVATSGLGNSVELRYKGGSCRHVWGRTAWPTTPTHPIWAARTTPYPDGNTLGYGYGISNSSGVRWSMQLEDAGYKTKVCVDTGSPGRCTPKY